MRGSKGGFWDRLSSRIRYRKIAKQKKEKFVEQEKINSRLEKKLKSKREEIQVLYVLSNENKFARAAKKRNLKIHKKGIQSKILIQTNEYKKIINPKSNKNDNILENNDYQKNVSKKKRKVDISSKIETKNVSVISNKTISKRKKGIKTTKKNDKQLREKSAKLIDELNKLIDNNREKINELTFEISNLKNNLKNAKNIKEVEEIEQKLYKLKQKLIEIMNNYANVKDGSFSKINSEKIDKTIDEIKKIDPNFKFNEIVDKVSPNLDYYNEMSNCVIDTTNMIYSADYQKDVINYKNTEENDMNVKLGDFSEINARLSRELDKHKDVIKEFNVLISKISPQKIVKIQNDFLSTFLHNTGCLITTFLSIPFLKKPKNVPLFAFGLFTINNSIRSMRKVTTNENISFIPSDDYANQIIKSKNSFGFVDYMISDSLYQISSLKEEYKINFSSFYDSEEFEKNLEKIISIEEKILKQAEEIKQLKNKYENTLDKNYEKVLKIKNIK